MCAMGVVVVVVVVVVRGCGCGVAGYLWRGGDAGRQAGRRLAISHALARSLRESTALSKTLRLRSGPRREERGDASTGPLGGGRAECAIFQKEAVAPLGTHSRATINSTIISNDYAQCVQTLQRYHLYPKLGTLYASSCLSSSPAAALSPYPPPLHHLPIPHETRRGGELLPLFCAVLPGREGDEDVRPFVTVLGRYLCYPREL